MGRIALAVLVLALSALVAAKKSSSSSKEKDPNYLSQKAFEQLNIGNESQAMKLFAKVLKVQPNNANALVQLGMRQMGKPETETLGFERLEQAFREDCVPMPVPIQSQQGQWIASIIGRRRFELKDFMTANKFFEKAATAGTAALCQKLQYATSLMTPFPLSRFDARQRIQKYSAAMDEIINRLEDGEDMGPNDGDPYAFCLLTAFYHTAYYDASHKSTMGKHMAVAIQAFPELQYTAPHLARLDDHQDLVHLAVASAVGGCDRRLKVGFVSGMMYRGTPPMADFGGVLGKLSRDDFELTFVYLRDIHSPTSDGILDRRGANDFPPYGYHQIVKEEDRGLTIDKKAGWLGRARAALEKLELDVLVYLDTSMSPMTNQLAMSRLARVQAVSHGHPTTSGLPKHLVDYYISWGAAEIPGAGEHYTEQLVVLPANTMHQYYESRVTEEGASTEDGQPFFHLTRKDFADTGLPAERNWYLCMQKPFKRHPEFEDLLARIHSGDAASHLILHDAEGEESRELVRMRLKKAGIDMSRVTMLGALPHHRLLALYMLSDVTLDSFPMGGCTTTREALEVGGLVVTLPRQYLGSRWSTAYYNIMEIPDLIAKDVDDYLRIAIAIATQPQVRAELKERVAARLDRMYRREEAVEAWTAMLRKLANKHTHCGGLPGQSNAQRHQPHAAEEAEEVEEEDEEPVRMFSKHFEQMRAHGADSDGFHVHDDDEDDDEDEDEEDDDDDDDDDEDEDGKEEL